MQTLILSLVARETSSDAIKELLKGCQVGFLSGTVNTKYRDYDAEDILEELYEFDVQKAERLDDDGASVIKITMFVPDSERERVETWLKDNEDTVAEREWGVAVGDSVDVDTMDGVLNIEFRGTVVGFKGRFAQVEDMDGDVFDVVLGDVETV